MRFAGPCFLLLCCCLGAFHCTKDVGRRTPEVSEHNFPPAVAGIFLNKCATSGCHNNTSYLAAGRLNLSSWEKLFEGKSSGAVVIPFRPDHSTLMYSINSFDEFGTLRLQPQMPLNAPALSREETRTIYEWIRAGAAAADGHVAFEPLTGRKMIYVANQGCDLVTVFDGSSMLAMRYVDVGETRNLEAPNMISVAPDNRHWYVSLLAGGFFQKFSTTDNTLEGRVNLGFGAWSSFVISSDSKKAFVADHSANGKIAVVDLEEMSAVVYPGFSYPHGLALSSNNRFLYAGAQHGNYIYRINADDPSLFTKVVIDESNSPYDEAETRPYDIVFTPDGAKYFVSCEGTNELRVFEAAADTLIAVLPVGKFPQKMALSASTPYLFVSCLHEPGEQSQQQSMISVVNYQNNAVVKSVYAGFQSHGLAVDDQYGRVYVTNRNISSEGPPPHHSGFCDGRNGYVTAIDLKTLELVPNFSAEVSVDPFSAAATH